MVMGCENRAVESDRGVARWVLSGKGELPDR
jgi:hypothetical protein